MNKRFEFKIHHNTTHGMTKTPTYETWHQMKRRCFNINSKDFCRYGGRGITVCERWMKFENFLFDMGKRPNGMTIERIDNNKGYEYKNCRWATAKEQARNKRTSLKYTFNGKTQYLIDWSKENGIGYQTLRQRLVDLGWSVDRAFNILPSEYHAKKI